MGQPMDDMEAAAQTPDSHVRMGALMDAQWAQMRQAMMREAAAVAEHAVIGAQLARAVREVAKLKARIAEMEPK